METICSLHGFRVICKNHAYAYHVRRASYNSSYPMTAKPMNSRIALSNDPVFNKSEYVKDHIFELQRKI